MNINVVKMKVNIQTIAELHKLVLMDSFPKLFIILHWRRMLIEVWYANIIDFLVYNSELQFRDMCFSIVSKHEKELKKRVA
jgi:hypothetical protein